MIYDFQINLNQVKDLNVMKPIYSNKMIYTEIIKLAASKELPWLNWIMYGEMTYNHIIKDLSLLNIIKQDRKRLSTLVKFN